MAAAIARAIASASAAAASAAGATRSPLAAFLSRRLFFAGAASLAGLARHRLAPSAAPLSHAVGVLAAPGATRLNQVRFRVPPFDDMSDSPLESGSEPDSPMDSGSDSTDGLSTGTLPGLDYQHWCIIMDKPGGEGATKQQIIDCYIQTLAKVVGSEEEAKKKIYGVSYEPDLGLLGFGCEIDEETSKKLGGLPGVVAVPDFYNYPEDKDYGGELFVNGEVVRSSPERLRRIRPPPMRDFDAPVLLHITRYGRKKAKKKPDGIMTRFI